MGAPSHPLDSQTVRGSGTAWLAACCPYTTQCCDQGTLHTLVAPQTGLWLYQLSWLFLGRNRRGGDRRGRPLYPALWLPQIS